MYKKVFEGGRALRAAPMTLRYARAEGDCTRVGFIIRKQFGNACRRNSLRRVLRVAFQQALPGMRADAWMIFDVSNQAARMRRGELKAEADRLLSILAREA